MMAALVNMAVKIPEKIRDAVVEAIAIAVSNTPESSGRVIICANILGGDMFVYGLSRHF